MVVPACEPASLGTSHEQARPYLQGLANPLVIRASRLRLAGWNQFQRVWSEVYSMDQTNFAIGGQAKNRLCRQSRLS